MAADAEARLRKREEEFAEQSKADYDRISERDEKIEELQKQIETLRQYGHERKREVTDLKLEIADKKGSKALQQEIEKLKKDVASAKASSNWAQDTKDKETKELKQKLTDERKRLYESEKTSKQAEGVQKELRKQISNLEFQLTAVGPQTTAANEQAAAAKRELKQANEELEKMFADLPGRSLQDYIRHTRQELETSRLKREASQTSLVSSQEPDPAPSAQPPKKGTSKRHVSGASLQDQLDDAGYASSANGEPDDENEETIINIPHQPFTLSDIISTDIAPIAASPPPEPTVRTIVHTTQAPTPSTFPEIWTVLPWWFKLLFCMLVGTYMYLCYGVACERMMWLAANDTSRQRVVALGEGSETSILMPVFVAFENLLGFDYSLLG